MWKRDQVGTFDLIIRLLKDVETDPRTVYSDLKTTATNSHVAISYPPEYNSEVITGCIWRILGKCAKALEKMRSDCIALNDESPIENVCAYDYKKLQDTTKDALNMRMWYFLNGINGDQYNDFRSKLNGSMPYHIIEEWYTLITRNPDVIRLSVHPDFYKYITMGCSMTTEDTRIIKQIIDDIRVSVMKKRDKRTQKTKIDEIFNKYADEISNELWGCLKKEFMKLWCFDIKSIFKTSLDGLVGEPEFMQYVYNETRDAKQSLQNVLLERVINETSKLDFIPLVAKTDVMDTLVGQLMLSDQLENYIKTGEPVPGLFETKSVYTNPSYRSNQERIVVTTDAVVHNFMSNYVDARSFSIGNFTFNPTNFRNTIQDLASREPFTSVVQYAMQYLNVYVQVVCGDAISNISDAYDLDQNSYTAFKMRIVNNLFLSLIKYDPVVANILLKFIHDDPNLVDRVGVELLEIINRGGQLDDYIVIDDSELTDLLLDLAEEESQPIALELNAALNEIIGSSDLIPEEMLSELLNETNNDSDLDVLREFLEKPIPEAPGAPEAPEAPKEPQDPFAGLMKKLEKVARDAANQFRKSSEVALAFVDVDQMLSRKPIQHRLPLQARKVHYTEHDLPLAHRAYRELIAYRASIKTNPLVSHSVPIVDRPLLVEMAKSIEAQLQSKMSTEAIRGVRYNIQIIENNLNPEIVPGKRKREEVIGRYIPVRIVDEPNPIPGRAVTVSATVPGRAVTVPAIDLGVPGRAVSVPAAVPSRAVTVPAADLGVPGRAVTVPAPRAPKIPGTLEEEEEIAYPASKKFKSDLSESLYGLACDVKAKESPKSKNVANKIVANAKKILGETSGDRTQIMQAFYKKYAPLSRELHAIEYSKDQSVICNYVTYKEKYPRKYTVLISSDELKSIINR
jgi:hypothetical protein